MVNLGVIILSSAVVSGLITLILGHFFENKRYTRNKKLSIYTEFLEQLDKVISPEQLAGDTSFKELAKTFFIETSKLEKFVWKVKLISQNEEVKNNTEKIFSINDSISELLENKIKGKTTGETKGETLDELQNKSNDLRDTLIDEMQKDINSFF